MADFLNLEGGLVSGGPDPPSGIDESKHKYLRGGGLLTLDQWLGRNSYMLVNSAVDAGSASDSSVVTVSAMTRPNPRREQSGGFVDE